MGLRKQYSTLYPMKFDLLELRKNIEEKRLLWGERLEQFLLKKLWAFGGLLKGGLTAPSGALVGCWIIIAISILARSTRDIGPESAQLLDIANHGITASHFSLIFCLSKIPHFLANFFSSNLILAQEIFVNLLGIAAIYFSAKILERSDIAKDRTVFNLIILSFACGFFLRVFTLQFNEFATETSYFLALIFPYLSYQFLEESKFKKSDQILLGLIAAVLFFLKANYVIFIVVFEVAKLLQKNSFLPAFCLRNFITFFLVIFYLVFLHLPGSYEIKASAIFSVIHDDLFPIFLLIFLNSFLLQKFSILRPLFLAVIAAFLLLISEMDASYDARSAFYSLSLPLVTLLLFYLIKSKAINWQRDSVILFLIFIVPQFDPEIFSQVIFNFGVFWWIFALILAASWRRVGLGSEHYQRLSLTKQFLLPHNLFSRIYFAVMVLATFAFASNKKYEDLAWIFLTIILLALISLQQKLYEEFYRQKELSHFSNSAICLVVAYVFSLHLTAVFNLPVSGHEYKSPNYLSEQMHRAIKNYAAEEEEITIISEKNSTRYPLIIYAKKENDLSALAQDLSNIKQQILRAENRLIFSEKTDNCSINSLELYLRDEEFRKAFLKNYIFKNRIITKEKSEKKVQFFDEEKNIELPQSLETITSEVEIYIRKNGQ